MTLEKLEWVDQAFNLVLIGPPGTGKTHIALAVGNKAVERVYKVFFSPMDTLMHILKTREISTKSAAAVGRRFWEIAFSPRRCSTG